MEIISDEKENYNNGVQARASTVKKYNNLHYTESVDEPTELKDDNIDLQV